MELNRYIDHTILKPEAAVDDVIKLCREAGEHRFAAVCVNPCYVDLCAHLLKGTGVKVATVIGFPLGASFTEIKVGEAKQAVLCKADELDMVINLGAAKAGRWDFVLEEIRQVVAAGEGAIIKVIVETALLTTEEKRLACQTVLDSGAHFIKTSTGFGPGGAAVEDIQLFRKITGDRIGIKASGAIRTREQAEAMIQAGATRIGTSNGVAIVKQFT
jgi:deoxyribose-phosphate aldolase